VGVEVEVRLLWEQMQQVRLVEMEAQVLLLQLQGHL
jgi:hypothetical protein